MQSPSLCMPVNGVPRAKQGQQQLSKPALSLWEVSRDVCTFGAVLWAAVRRAPEPMFGL